MSHWKTFTNDALKDTDMDILERALGQMNVQLDTNVKSISNPGGKEAVDMGFITRGNVIPLGFKESDGNLQLKGDFYSTGLREETFMNELSQLYTKEKIIKQLEEARYTIESVELNEQSEYEILAYTYA